MKPKTIKFEMEIPVNKNSEINHFKKNKSVNLFNIKKLSDNKMDYTIKIIQNKNNSILFIYLFYHLYLYFVESFYFY